MQAIKSILPFLLQRLDEQRLAFFIGAGIPASEGGLPDGSELRTRLLREMGDNRSDETLPEVAGRFENERDRPSLYDFLRENLKSKGATRKNLHCPTYGMLLDLPVRTFLTTNFDPLFERRAREAGADLSTFRTDGQLANYKPAERSLLKVHGDLQVAPNEIVITSADYSAYIKLHPQFSHWITHTFYVDTVVFLGYSLSDSNFIHLYTSVLESEGGLKKKSYAIVNRDPGVKIRGEWASRKIEIVVATAQDFVRYLHRAYKRRADSARQQKEAVRVTRGHKLDRPHFSSKSASNRARKTFAYFVSRQKALLKTEAYFSCTIDTLQVSAELLNPNKRVAQLISAKALDIAAGLKDQGYYPEVLPPLDQIAQKIRRRKIAEANFCILIISSSSYEAYLNKLYGAVASTKPILVFVHNNFNARLKQDLLFRGLSHAGAELTLFKTGEVSSCALRGKLEQLLETETDEWLARTLNM